MRKLNAIISVFLIVLLCIHGVAGGFQMLGVFPGGSTWLKVLSWTMIGCLALHVIIGTILTIESIRACKRSGVSYFRENLLFWVRRISGFAIILFIVLHVMIFIGGSGESYRLNLFAGPQLAASILLVAALAVHIVTNIKPLLLALGARGVGTYVKDMLLVASLLLFFSAVAFIIYYFRWNLI